MNCSSRMVAGSGGDRAGVGASAQKALRLPGHCEWVTYVASANGDHPQENARAELRLDVAVVAPVAGDESLRQGS